MSVRQNSPPDLPEGLSQLCTHCLAELASSEMAAAILIWLPSGEWRLLSNVKDVSLEEFLEDGLTEILNGLADGSAPKREISAQRN